jgi:tetratricopeptide (TPR) repeat protein
VRAVLPFARRSVMTASVIVLAAATWLGLVSPSLAHSVGAHRVQNPQPPASASVHRDRGTAYTEEGRWEEASREFEHAIRLDPTDARTHYLLGFCYTTRAQEAEPALARELLERSVSALKTALERNPRLAEAHHELGTAYHLQRRSSEGIAAYLQAIALRPGWAAPRFNLAGVYADADMFDQALSEYRHLLQDPGELQNSLHRIHSAIAATYQRAEKPDEAIAAFKTSITLNGDYYVARVGLGNLYFELSKFEAAIAEYKEAIRLQPQDPALDFSVCRLYAILKKDDDALLWLENAMRKGLDPTIPRTSGLLRRFGKDPRFQKLVAPL